MPIFQVIAEAKRLADSLAPLPEPESKPAMVVVSDLPDTGKTTFSRRLAARLPFDIVDSHYFINTSHDIKPLLDKIVREISL